MARSPVPIIVTGAGEGGSGGALAIAVGDKVNILENAFYSVISPEGCAAIMWRDAGKGETAATALKISAKELSEMGLVDEIVPEPDGGAHADHEATAHLLDSVLERNLLELLQLTPRQLTESRYAKFRRMGQFFNGGDGERPAPRLSPVLGGSAWRGADRSLSFFGVPSWCARAF